MTLSNAWRLSAVRRRLHWWRHLIYETLDEIVRDLLKTRFPFQTMLKCHEDRVTFIESAVLKSSYDRDWDLSERLCSSSNLQSSLEQSLLRDERRLTCRRPSAFGTFSKSIVVIEDCFSVRRIREIMSKGTKLNIISNFKWKYAYVLNTKVFRLEMFQARACGECTSFDVSCQFHMELRWMYKLFVSGCVKYALVENTFVYCLEKVPIIRLLRIHQSSLFGSVRDMCSRHVLDTNT